LTELDELREGLAAEERMATIAMSFRVMNAPGTLALLTLEVKPETRNARLDDSLEEARISWGDGTTAGSGEVLLVEPDLNFLCVVIHSGSPPRWNDLVRVWPPNFLGKLKELWADPTTAISGMAWRNRMALNSANWKWVVTPTAFPTLRPAQKNAFKLPGWKVSFLWGPPGTGKTSTLGCLLATLAMKRPHKPRILLLSTTNTAVDQAMVAIDKALQQLEGKGPRRVTRVRFGSRFDPKYYSAPDKKHMVPLRDPELVNEYKRLLENPPLRSDLGAYERWKLALKEVRDRIAAETLQFLQRADVAAMTTTYAVFRSDLLQQIAPYDLIVFDEASQVSVAHAFMLARLGEHVLFAGDPRQLSPIVQANSGAAKRWMGRSPFDMKLDVAHAEECAVRLDEQFRMAPRICDFVREQFYPEGLRVAEPAMADAAWHAERQVLHQEYVGSEAVTLVPIKERAGLKEGFGFNSYHCQESAELAVRLAMCFKGALDPIRPLILTPYRAQRATMLKLVYECGGGVDVFTVHRAQGSERRVVIFDPVRPDSKFLQEAEGRRLLNVAMSRAQGQLVVMMPPGYLENRVLKDLRGMFPFRDLKLDALPEPPRKERSSAPPTLLPRPRVAVPIVVDVREQLRDALQTALAGVPARERMRVANGVGMEGKFSKLPIGEREQLIRMVVEGVGARGGGR
jgi:DNA replication ATP-dependent helicase Dna2